MRYIELIRCPTCNRLVDSKIIIPKPDTDVCEQCVGESQKIGDVLPVVMENIKARCEKNGNYLEEQTNPKEKVSAATREHQHRVIQATREFMQNKSNRAKMAEKKVKGRLFL